MITKKMRILFLLSVFILPLGLSSPTFATDQNPEYDPGAEACAKILTNHLLMEMSSRASLTLQRSIPAGHKIYDLKMFLKKSGLSATANNLKYPIREFDISDDLSAVVIRANAGNAKSAEPFIYAKLSEKNGLSVVENFSPTKLIPMDEMSQQPQFILEKNIVRLPLTQKLLEKPPFHLRHKVLLPTDIRFFDLDNVGGEEKRCLSQVLGHELEEVIPLSDSVYYVKTVDTGEGEDDMIVGYNPVSERINLYRHNSSKYSSADYSLGQFLHDDLGPFQVYEYDKGRRLAINGPKFRLELWGNTGSNSMPLANPGQRSQLTVFPALRGMTMVRKDGGMLKTSYSLVDSDRNPALFRWTVKGKTSNAVSRISHGFVVYAEEGDHTGFAILNDDLSVTYLNELKDVNIYSFKIKKNTIFAITEAKSDGVIELHVIPLGPYLEKEN